MAFTKKQQKQTKDLAQAYAAYIEAKKERDTTKTKLWAELLLDLQQRYGVEIIEAFYIKATLSGLEA